MDWVAPDIAEPPARAPRPTAPPPGAATGLRPPELRRLAPMTVPDILDGGFAILRRAPATILAFTAVFVVPIQVLGAWLNRGTPGLDLGGAIERGDTIQLGGASGASGAAYLVLQLGPKIALVYVAAALARLVSAWQVGHDLTLGELLRVTITRSWPLLASWVLVHLLEGVSIVGLGVLPLAVMTWFIVTAPVIGAEGIGPIAAMRRSARLVARRFWMVLGIALLGLLVESLFGLAIGLLPTLLSAVFGTRGIGWVLPAVAGTVTELITMPVVAGITVLIYLDLRVRTEGLDIELDAIDVLPTEG